MPMSAPSFDVLIRSEETGGALSVIRIGVPAGWEGPPLHRHDFDETFYVLEGELTFQLADELMAARPGDCAFAPRNGHHTLANLGGETAAYVLTCTPAGFERYFDRIAADQAGVAPPPEANGPIPHTTVVGPPIAQDPEPIV
jgi:quercetin dioxygenase-like cupin family protein